MVQQQHEIKTDAERIAALTAALEGCMHFLRFSQDACAIAAYRRAMITKTACGGDLPETPYHGPYPELDQLLELRQIRAA